MRVCACVRVGVCECHRTLDGFCMCALAARIWLGWKAHGKVDFMLPIFIYEHNKANRTDIVEYMYEHEGNELFVNGNLFFS